MHHLKAKVSIFRLDKKKTRYLSILLRILLLKNKNTRN